jgi:probable phosphoglycerate mutase
VTAGRLILWRHGQTAHNSVGRIQGASDVPLNAAGQAQVTHAAEVLARMEPAAIVASDLSRARATAEALAQVTGLPVRTDARLRERAYGQWEGLSFDDVRERWPVESAAWRRGKDVVSVGMETRSASAARFVTAVMEAALPMDDADTLVIASHGGVIVCGLSVLLGLDPVEWVGLRVLAHARWAVVEAASHASSGWRLVAYGVGASPGDGWDF